MKRYNPNNWLDELIYNEKLSNEAIYAIYLFLEKLLMHFEMRTLHKLRSYKQEEKDRNLHKFQNDGADPF